MEQNSGQKFKQKLGEEQKVYTPSATTPGAASNLPGLIAFATTAGGVIVSLSS